MVNAFSLRNFRKVVVQVLFLAMVSSFCSSFYGQVSRATDPNANPPCVGVGGQGMKWPVSGNPPVYDPNGTPNSGVVHFGAYQQVGPDIGYQACAVDMGNFLQVEGWAWDDNLGWVSFYCPAGAGALNQGASCASGNPNGNFEGGYGVTIDKVSGKFSGYAWNDNAGWISFDNSPFSDVKIEVNGPVLCQGIVYGPNDAPAGCPPHTNADVLAWSDALGWFDFDGMSLVLQPMNPQLHVVLSLVKTGTNFDPSQLTVSNAPLADNNESYTLQAQVLDDNNNPVDDSKYTVTAMPEWAVDTVKKDQVDPAPAFDNKNCGNAAGAVTKPCGALQLAAPGSGNYIGTITSVAPTSNMNGYFKGADELSVDFAYDDFLLPSGKSVPHNDLQLDKVLVSVKDLGNNCVYGDPNNNCAGIPASLDPTQSTLKFRPQTAVSLKGPNDNVKFVEIGGANLLSPFNTTVSGPAGATVVFKSGIDQYMGNDYNFLFDSNSSGILDFSADPIMVDDKNNMTWAGQAQLQAGIAVNPNAAVQPPSPLPGLFMYSTVSEPNGVSYFSDKLPKVTGSIAVVPIAIIQGSVYSTGAAPTTNNIQQAVQVFGDVTTNVLRDTIYKNVSNIIAGVPQPMAADKITLIPDQVGFQSNNQGGNLAKLLPDASNKEKVYYHYGDLVLDSNMPNTNISWKGERTIIVKGGSVFIKANLLPQAPNGNEVKPKLGIIVLKDLTDPNNNQAAQGNIYIDPTVTNIQANMYADGAVFSAPINLGNPSPVDMNAQGEPKYADVLAQQNILKHSQLLIEGSLASQNTIGGSSLAVPITGTGAQAMSQLQARLYDLNYLRYYTGVLKRDMNGQVLCGTPPGHTVADEAALNLTDAQGLPITVYSDALNGCLYSPVDPDSGVPVNDYHSAYTDPNDKKIKLGATYVIFDPSSTLPGFNSNAAGTQTQLPQ